MPDTAHPNPAAGGSYTRDPITGQLTLVERTTEPSAEPPADPAPQQQPTPEA